MVLITAGRVWWLCINYWPPTGDVSLDIGLSQLSIPACPKVTYSIKPQRMKPGFTNELPVIQLTYGLDISDLLVPLGWVSSVYRGQVLLTGILPATPLFPHLKVTSSTQPRMVWGVYIFTWTTGLWISESSPPVFFSSICINFKL